MNLDLYNKLDQAYKFAVKDKQEYQPQITSRRIYIKQLTQSMDYEPEYQKEPVDWKDILMWVWIFFPVALIKLLINAIKNHFGRKKYDKEVKAKFDRIAHRNSIKAQIAAEQQQLAELEAQRENHLRYYAGCFASLPNHHRNPKHISMLRDYVKMGMANTLDRAYELVGAAIWEMDELNRQHEERMERERQFRQTQDALETIARNQERIYDHLETERRRRDNRW